MSIGRFFSRIFNRRPAAPTPSEQPAPPSPPPANPGPPPARDTFERGSMRVNVASATGFNTAEKAKLDQATQLMGRVLGSREFRDAILGATYNGKPGFADDPRSPTEIYDAIRAGKESFTAEANGQVDLNLNLRSLSWFNRNVVGYTTANSDTITTNRRFFSSYTPAEVAGHLAHEWAHKLGFEHDHGRTAERPHSLPYVMGDLVERLAKGPLTPLE